MASETLMTPKIIAETILEVYRLVLLIPKKALKRSIKIVQDDTAVGPLLNPGKFQGDRFKRNDTILKRARLLLQLRELLQEDLKEVK